MSTNNSLSSLSGEEPIGPHAAAEVLRIAMRALTAPFLKAAAEGRIELRPNHWIAIGLVRGRASCESISPLMDAVSAARAALGPASDFGDTPPGNALKQLYKAAEELSRAVEHFEERRRES